MTKMFRILLPLVLRHVFVLDYRAERKDFWTDESLEIILTCTQSVGLAEVNPLINIIERAVTRFLNRLRF